MIQAHRRLPLLSSHMASSSSLWASSTQDPKSATHFPSKRACSVPQFYVSKLMSPREEVALQGPMTEDP